MSKRSNAKLYEFLEAQGVLENGTDAEIKAAKKTYRQEYLTKYKRNQRLHRPEFWINFSDKREYSQVKQASRKHKMAITGFMRQAVLSYLDKRYIVPDTGQIARLEEVLAATLNEIQSIVRKKERYFFDRDDKYVAIEKRIMKLENQINEIFRNPPLSKQ